MVEPEFVLGGLKAVFDRPAMSLDLDQSFDARSGRTPGREEGHIAIDDVVADQQASRPQTDLFVVIFGRVEISQFAIGPVAALRSPSPADRRFHDEGSSARAISDAIPAIGGRRFCMIGTGVARHAKHIAFAGAP